MMPGARGAAQDGVLENLIAIGRFRSAASTAVQAAVVPGAIAHWRSSNDREIDFVVPVEREGQRIPVEVKGDIASRLGHARLAIRRAFGHGIVVSRSVFDWAEDVAVLPAPVFLAALAGQPRRALAVA